MPSPRSRCSRFRRRLAERQPDPAGRRWVYVPYDQLSDGLGPLAVEAPEEVGIVLIETPWKARRRPYHKQKLAYVLANQRQFALEQAARGVAVRYETGAGSYREILEPLIAELGPLRLMEPAERELRADVRPLVEAGDLDMVPHDGWLTTPEEFREGAGDEPPWRMDAFYRLVRKRTGILMDEDDKPVGGKYSFDAENRERWNGEPAAPDPPRFESDDVTEEVAALIEDVFGTHPGRIDPSRVPATATDAERLWDWAKRECLPAFGPYEDAMSTASRGLFHTRISPLVNLHRLLPRQIVDETLALDLPLASQEGFLRQVIGWREFVRHVHRETDGFRRLPAGAPPVRQAPGDGGWGRWRGWEWPSGVGGPDGGAAPSALDADAPVPPAFWGERSGLNCLDTVVADVWDEGYSHHITRLMILSNIATLLGISPRDLTDWFWAAYVDAYDWVVEPNVLGMGTFAAGDIMTTKPYVSGAAYINRMSDYCGACDFDPRTTCPLTDLYWHTLWRNRDRLKHNNRMRLPLASARKRSNKKRGRDAKVFALVRDVLGAGEPLTPANLPKS